MRHLQLVCLMLVSGSAGLGAETPSAADFSKDVVPFLTRHCYSCHGNGKARGDLSLDQYKDDKAVQKDREVWETVVEMVRSGAMPPKGKDRVRPKSEEFEPVLTAVETVLARFDCGESHYAGRVTLRRLNRTEYNNTVRDLVGVDFQPAADFPNDDVGYGFDNIGDVLSLSPLLFEKYLTAAETILERAIVSVEPPGPSQARLEGLRTSFGAGDSRRGAPYLHSSGSISGQSYLDAGDYHLRIVAFGQQVGDEPVRAVLRVDGADVKEFAVKAERSNPETIEVKVRLKTGTSRIAVSFLNPYTAPKPAGDEKSEEKPKPGDLDPSRRLLFVRSISLDGPYDPPPPVLPESHQRIMAHPADLPPRAAARAIVTKFANRAFRRPVKPDEVDRLLRLYDEAEKEGERFEDRIRLALQGALVGPDFLFRVELDPADARAGTAYPVSEYELASRLSYFLWSSMPDEELFAAAAEGRLRRELDVQVRRMLKDEKSSEFVRNFAGQWLTLRKLAYVAPDPKTFPGWDEALRAAMVRETELFFEAVVREDRSILDLLDADFSFVNDRLARHYGIEGVAGPEFRRVKLPANRGGILTQASILTLTSNPTRTAPVKRGKWVLDQILNTPPPPPPPDVPAFPEEKRLTGSLRQIMEQHRENALCASCHQRMDPIGFAFENYDAIGAWRDRDGAFPVDPSGVLPGGRTFQGPAELKVILREKKEQFSRCLTEKMLTYALGRGLEPEDRCAVDAVLKALRGNEYRFSVLLTEVIKSDPFQMRTATGDEP